VHSTVIPGASTTEASVPATTTPCDTETSEIVHSTVIPGASGTGSSPAAPTTTPCDTETSAIVSSTVIPGASGSGPSGPAGPAPTGPASSGYPGSPSGVSPVQSSGSPSGPKPVVTVTSTRYQTVCPISAGPSGWSKTTSMRVIPTAPAPIASASSGVPGTNGGAPSATPTPAFNAAGRTTFSGVAVVFGALCAFAMI
jgi:hypothetical protein